MYTYFLERNDRKSVWELCARPRGGVIRQSKTGIFTAGDQTIDGYMELHDLSIYQEEGGLAAEQTNGNAAHNAKKASKENGVGADPQTNHIRSKACSLM